MLDDLFETQKLFDWHQQDGSVEKPRVTHANLNYHAKAFEQVDHYLRNVIAVLSRPDTYFKGRPSSSHARKCELNTSGIIHVLIRS